MQAAAGWVPHRLRVDPQGAAGRSPLPLLVLERRRSRALRALAGTELYVPRGPVCASGDEPAWAAVLDVLDTIAAATGAAAVTVEPPGGDEDAAAVAARLGARGFRRAAARQPEHTAVVDLHGGEAAVLARMRPKGRYNARLAERRGVVALRGGGEPAAGTLAALLAATAVRQGIHQPGADHVARVLHDCPGSFVMLAGVDGEAVAGALVAVFADTGVYLYGGSLQRHRERQASALLHLAVMRQLVAAGCGAYDLWGLPPDADPAHPWHGLRQFKLSLGGAPRSLPGAWRLTRRPAAAATADALGAARRRLRRLRVAAPASPAGEPGSPAG